MYLLIKDHLSIFSVQDLCQSNFR